MIHGWGKPRFPRRRALLGVGLTVSAIVLLMGPAFASGAGSSPGNTQSSSTTATNTTGTDQGTPATPPTTTPPTTTPPTTTPPTTTPPTTTPPTTTPHNVVGAQSGQSTTQTASVTTEPFTGQGTNNGTCATFQTDTPPIAISPGQQEWQFNLTDLVNPQPVSGQPALTYQFSDGTSASGVTPPNTFTGDTAKWFVVTTAGATLDNSPATFATGVFKDTGNPQLVISHCWGGGTATGSLSVSKSVVGTVASGTQFTVNIACNNSVTPSPTSLTFTTPGDLGPKSVTNIPVGTICTVIEQAPGGGAVVSYSPSGANTTGVTVTSTTTPVKVTVTNTYAGSLSVSKSTFGTVASGTQFTVNIACNHGVTPSPTSLTFTTPNDLGPKSVTNIPLGTTCTVVESGTGGASLVSYQPSSANTTGVTVTSTTTPVAVTINNIFPGASTVGSVEVHKVVTGAGRPPNEVKAFTANVSCTDGTNVNLTFGTAGGSQTVQGINIAASGTTTCTVTEPDSGGASNVSFAPEGNGQFILNVDSPAHTITLTNRFDPVSVSVGGIGVGGVLPFTGSSTSILVKIGAWLVGIGGVMWLVMRRRRQRGFAS